MLRRDFIKLLSTTPLWAQSLIAHGENTPRWDRIVVLIELKGANDSLNTFIPYQQTPYYENRPHIAVAKNKVISLGQIGLHPALKPLMPLWDKKQLALVHGLGYPNANLTHAAALNTWNSGAAQNLNITEGWITRCFMRTTPPKNIIANGIALTDDIGPLEGGDQSKVIVVNNPRQFLNRAEQVEDTGIEVENPALQHIIEVQKAIKDASRSMFEKLLDENYLSQSPFKSNIDAQLSTVGYLINRGIATSVYKLAHGSFDTHSNQVPQHDRLLQELAEALINFKSQMESLGLWDRVVVVTYSEFGRSLRENAKLGTDHGTAASHLLLGGSVNGGHYGQVPSLTDLDNGQLKFTTDFRHVYTSIIEKWWNISASSHPFTEFPALPLFS